MDELLGKIYKEIIYFEEDTVQIEKKIVEEVGGLLESYQTVLDTEQREELQSLLYEAVHIAEAESFWLGVRYALKVFMKLTAG